ncbi:DNA repair protein XRCC2 homolog isoform X5 [Cannabis sativa]|uniref:DNA repair protein XRCC2 homolog isoform X5 n=1 Tax=Cannabis sativa TaxID=3483 RepID=UPI0011DF6070|nr:DNA repair protein XRCC2 homolog isoform X5 [Cannabis sativa]XP_060973258.1 DNA repair protein XRCC2 homolog isoform X5 [Cannabis sativa]
MEVRRWIDGDESAGDMLTRFSIERPFLLLLPPLHRVPLRVGNVLELVGPSSSAKTLILIQAAISCILPKDWNGVHYGGLGRLVVFIDLDCRFDILCFSTMLKRRIGQANGLLGKTNVGRDHLDTQKCDERRKSTLDYDEELYALCMRRFLYVRCYDSFQFLASLKTLHYQLKQVEEAQQSSVYLLMIDSIGAFHWVERASSFSQSSTHRKKYFPGTTSTHKVPCREYMPSVWQSFVTHRILIRASDDDSTVRHQQIGPVYLSEWLLPPLSLLDKFTVKDGFFLLVS